MSANYTKLFIEHLRDKCKYPAEAIVSSVYKYDGKEYGRVEVYNEEGIIVQAFVLMSEDQMNGYEKFPFYRTYYQRNRYGYIVNPACNVAVYDGKEWHFRSSTNLRHEITQPDFLVYAKAVERFRERFAYLGNRELAQKITKRSFGIIAVIVVYGLAHLISINAHCSIIIPFDSTTIKVALILIALLILPPLIPYIKSITIKDVSVELNN